MHISIPIWNLVVIDSRSISFSKNVSNRVAGTEQRAARDTAASSAPHSWTPTLPPPPAARTQTSRDSRYMTCWALALTTKGAEPSSPRDMSYLLLPRQRY